MTTHSNRISFSPTNVKTHIKLDNILSNHRPSVGQYATTFSRLILMMMFALAMKTAEAKVVRVEVEERVLLANGHFFGNVGQYEKIRGTIHYEVDPENPASAAIVDLEFAPKNVRGMVEFSGDFMLLIPLDMSKANVPPVITGHYPTFVPATDKDGNGIGGIRLPDITVPLGTYQ